MSELRFGGRVGVWRRLARRPAWTRLGRIAKGRAHACFRPKERECATRPGASVIYVVVPDADTAYVRAKAAGDEVTEPVEHYRTRDLTVTDPTATAGRSAPIQAPRTPIEPARPTT